MNDLELLRSLRAGVPDRGASERAARVALDALRAEMEGPPTRPPRKALRPRHVALALAVTFALLGVGAVVLDGSDSKLTPAPGTALAISRQVHWIELRIADNSASAEEMTRELSRAGIRGRVELVPVPADYVGVWILTSETAGQQATCVPRPGHSDPEPTVTVRLDDIERIPSLKPKTLRIPVARVRESTGEFAFLAGRPAKPGEQPIDPESAGVEDELLDIAVPTLRHPPIRLEPCGSSSRMRGRGLMPWPGDFVIARWPSTSPTRARAPSPPRSRRRTTGS